MPSYQGKTNGFKRSGKLIAPQIRKVTETRGFAESRILTHWAEIVGEETAAIARPVEVTYGRKGLGATLCLLTTGAHAPVLEMQKEQLRQRVNATYGYNAISRIRLTQTAPTGFAEGQAQFNARPKTNGPKPVDQRTRKEAHALAEDVTDTGLRDALEALAQNVLSKRDNQT